MAELNWPDLMLLPVNLWSLPEQLPESKEIEFNDADKALNKKKRGIVMNLPCKEEVFDLLDKEVEEENQVINQLKENLKSAIQDYISKNEGIYHIYALYELAADLTANTLIDDCFFTVFEEVAHHYFKGCKDINGFPLVPASEIVNKENMKITFSDLRDAIETYSPDFMHGIPKNEYLLFLSKIANKGDNDEKLF